MKPDRYIADMPHVVRDIITYDTVSTGKSTQKFSVPIGQTDGSSVKFQLTGIRKRLSDGLGGPCSELLHFTYTISVAK